MEDTSDAYYLSQHRKFEVFERRQRIREREKLVFERYKMRSRVDLLRNLPASQWATVVSAILARSDAGQWKRGREKLAAEGVDWLRRRLIREGKDVLGRYDQLLPSGDKRYVKAETKQADRQEDGWPLIAICCQFAITTSEYSEARCGGGFRVRSTRVIASAVCEGLDVVA